MSSLGRTARDIAAAVQRGELDPVDVVEQHLERITAVDPLLGAFEYVAADAAVAAARQLARRHDRASLPLAGVPVAIKDNVAVADMPFRNGSRATPAQPAAADGPVAAAVRAAGAIIVGKTRVPELDIWPSSDNRFGTARNPWDPRLVPGGSSGGSAAAVAAGMVPVAHGADGAGSIRIPAACCGLFGFKPGPGVAPHDGPDWLGMSEHGVLATTVTDGALLLDVIAGGRRFRRARLPDAPLRVAVSVAVPGPGIRIAKHWSRAVGDSGEALASAGHEVRTADPPAPLGNVLAIAARWTGGPVEDAAGLDRTRLEARTRTHLRIGDVLGRAVRESAVDAWVATMAPFWRDHDVLITPPVAHDPVEALAWHRRRWLSNALSSYRSSALTPAWNLARFPAATVPAGVGPTGLPVAVQVVGPRGADLAVVEVARLLEELRPWPRHAPPVDHG